MKTNNKDMVITPFKIKIRDIVKGYQDLGDDGVFAMDGKLNIRPPYQREFVYKPKQRDEVIRSIMRGRPLNIMYWSKNDDGTFEVMDGQQRTISACEYHDVQYSVDYRQYNNLTQEEQEAFLDYELNVNICEGTEKEKLEWFETINIGGATLTDQELRNSVYTGKWLADAKKKFSKPNCNAYVIAVDYIKGSAIRQDYLETALKWISRYQGFGSIEEYMAKHQHDHDADELYRHFEDVIKWTKRTFTTYYKEMKGVDWGSLYNLATNHKSFTDEANIPAMVSALMADEEVTNKKGIFSYLVTGAEKFLNLRAFPASIARTQYTKQDGKCAKCGVEEPIEEMEADHITPWSKGGKTDISNCQMLCIECNRTKSDK